MSHVGMIVLGFSIIFIMTSLGSSFVLFFKKEISEKVNTIFLGFASGVMIAASIWSLIIPAIDMATEAGTYGKAGWLPAAAGFLIGAIFMVLMDKIIPHIHKKEGVEEGPRVELTKATKMFLAVTIHNIPEGLALGFAFGVAYSIGTDAAMFGALSLAIGLAIQNLPEGAAVTLPMKTVTGSRFKAFGYGVLSGAVEPVFAVIGYFLASSIAVIQPWLLAFSAGAMIFVVVEDLIPEADLAKHNHLGTWALMIGFVVMMILDVALG